MGFMTKVRRAFGLDDEFENENSILADATPPARPRDIHGVTYASDDDEHEAVHDNVTRQADTAEVRTDTADIDTKCPEAIFTTVVEFFNSQLPPFVGKNLDTAAQARQIHDMLDESVRQYIADLDVKAREACAREYADERAAMLAQMEELRQSNRSVKESGENYKQQQLSAERQKRALTERVQDLEKQIAVLNADREQFELENKSLVNKLRLYSVTEGRDGDTDAAEELLNQNDTFKKEIESVRNECDELKRQAEAASDEVLRYQTAYDELKSKQQMSDVMLNDLNSKASEAIKQLADANGRVAELSRFEEESAQLRHQCESLQQVNATLRTENERGSAALQLLGDVQTQLDEFESARIKREARIKELLDELDLRDDQIVRLQAQIEELTRQIDSYRAVPHVSDSVPFDPSLDDTDWLVATPPPGTEVRTPGVPDSEFGYHEPKRRRQAADDPEQMSLFD